MGDSRIFEIRKLRNKPRGRNEEVLSYGYLAKYTKRDCKDNMQYY